MVEEKSRRIKVGILQTGHIGGQLGEKHGEYPEMFMNLFDGAPFDYRTYAVVDGIFPKHVLECDSWVITGSKHGVYEDFDWIEPLKAFIRKLAASSQPTVGICFGHQALAEALGGRVEKFDGGWNVGLQSYHNVENGEEAHLLAFHQDQVVEPPASAELLLTSDSCRYAGFKYSPSCFSIQPHPEHTVSFIADLIQARRGRQLSEDEADEALVSLNEPNDNVRYGHWIADVLSGQGEI